jgi:hypothetical protein
MQEERKAEVDPYTIFLETFQSILAGLHIFISLNHKNRVAVFAFNCKTE